MNINKKSGFTLVQIMVALLTLSIVMAASMPLITKRVKMPNRYTHGKYICYYDGNDLVQEYYNSMKKIKTERNPKHPTTGEIACTFDRPNKATVFKVDVIGAGAGGNDYFKYEGPTIPSDNIAEAYYIAGTGNITNGKYWAEPTDEQVYALLRWVEISDAVYTGDGGDGGSISYSYVSPRAAYCELNTNISVDSYNSNKAQNKLSYYVNWLINEPYFITIAGGAFEKYGSVPEYYNDYWLDENGNEVAGFMQDGNIVLYKDADVKIGNDQNSVASRERGFRNSLSEAFSDVTGYGKQFIQRVHSSTVTTKCYQNMLYGYGGFRSSISEINNDNDAASYFGSKTIPSSFNDEDLKNAQKGQEGFTINYKYRVKIPNITESKSYLKNLITNLIQIGSVSNLDGYDVPEYRYFNQASGTSDTRPGLSGSNGSYTSENMVADTLADYISGVKTGRVLIPERLGTNDGDDVARYAAIKITNPNYASSFITVNNSKLPQGGKGMQLGFCAEQSSSTSPSGSIVCSSEDMVGAFKPTSITDDREDLGRVLSYNYVNGSVGEFIGNATVFSGNGTLPATGTNFSITEGKAPKPKYPIIELKTNLAVYHYEVGCAGGAGEVKTTSAFSNMVNCKFTIPKGGSVINTDDQTEADIETIENGLTTTIACDGGETLSASGGEYNTAKLDVAYNTLDSIEVGKPYDPNGESEFKVTPSSYSEDLVGASSGYKPETNVFTRHQNLPAGLGAGGDGRGFVDPCARPFGTYSMAVKNSSSKSAATDLNNEGVSDKSQSQTIDPPSCSEDNIEHIPATIGGSGAVVISW